MYVPTDERGDHPINNAQQHNKHHKGDYQRVEVFPLPLTSGGCNCQLKSYPYISWASGFDELTRAIHSGVGHEVSVAKEGANKSLV
jgi:hypothetical protein